MTFMSSAFVQLYGSWILSYDVVGVVLHPTCYDDTVTITIGDVRVF